MFSRVSACKIFLHDIQISYTHQLLEEKRQAEITSSLRVILMNSCLNLELHRTLICSTND